MHVVSVVAGQVVLAEPPDIHPRCKFAVSCQQVYGGWPNVHYERNQEVDVPPLSD